MLRIVQSSSADHAKSYYTSALAKSDYYVKDNGQELPGVFKGKIAERLNLSSAVDRDKFFSLCENINPATGKNLTPKTRDNRRVGYDMNFHVPKSVSVLHALSNDSHILEAFEISVSETMQEIEADSMARVRKGGAYQDRKTGELIYAHFTHQTARPVDGSAPDPHLHAHCFVFNCTYDSVEKSFKAGQFGNIKMDAPYFEKRFNKRLSDKLIDLGYEIRVTDKNFEVVGVPDAVVKHFSRRTNQIGQFAKEHRIVEASALSEIGAKTRSKKQSGLSMDELKKEWRRQIAHDVEFSPSEKETPIRYNRKVVSSKKDAQDYIDYSVHHSFERASVMNDRRLLATAYHNSIGNRQVGLDAITECFANDTRIIRVKERNNSYCTTRQVLSEEKQMVDLARKGQGKFQPLYKSAPDIKLDGQQGAAIEHVLTTHNQVSIVMGAAGSGKTTLMTEANAHVVNANKEMFVFAPTSAAKEVLIKEGFSNAETVAKLLVDEKLQAKLNGQVMWIDEAGLLSTKDATGLLKIANSNNTRLVFGGDTRQHSSVVRGDALRIINTVGKVEAAEVNKIRRQSNLEYRAAVESFAKGDINTGFEKLDNMGAIKDVDPLKPNQELIADYINAAKQKKSVLVVSPTREQGKSVTKEIRKELQSSGLIGKKELTAVKFESLNFTEAQKTDLRQYRPGQVIQFSQNVPQIKRGSLWTVKDVAHEKVIISDADGQTKVLPNDRNSSFEVYEQTEIALSKGDQVRITRNGYDANDTRLTNGQTMEVVSINKAGDIGLINRQSKVSYNLTKGFGHIDHAYCTTSHSSQGKTVDQVLISQPSSTFTATDAKQFYVSVSRGKEAVKIYTDDKEKLLEYASELGDRHSALELVKNSPNHTEFVLQKEREKINQPLVNTPTKDSKTPAFNYHDSYEPGL
jgi:conjugative relaxase-like TrwC/TraI family protein